MNILVTGGCGFIGSHFVRKAIMAGHKIVNIDALGYAANPDNLSDIAGNPDYDFIEADICDELVMAAVFSKTNPDIIVHFAAESHVDKSIDDAGSFIKTNVLGTRVLLDQALAYWRSLTGENKQGFRFLHISTDEVYGDLGEDDPAFTETNAYAPNSPYAASKASADHLVRAWNNTYGLPVLISNCSNNYGPNQFPEKLIPLVILRALSGEKIPVYGDGSNIRDWLYVEDHVDAILQILENGKIGESYNIGGQSERSNLEIVNSICQILDTLHPCEKGKYQDLIEFVTDRPGHDKRYAMNINKIKSELGWKPETDFNEGIEKTVKWYLENQEWCKKILERTNAIKRQGLGDGGLGDTEALSALERQ